MSALFAWSFLSLDAGPHTIYIFAIHSLPIPHFLLSLQLRFRRLFLFPPFPTYNTLVKSLDSFIHLFPYPIYRTIQDLCF